MWGYQRAVKIPLNPTEGAIDTRSISAAWGDSPTAERFQSFGVPPLYVGEIEMVQDKTVLSRKTALKLTLAFFQFLPLRF